MTELTHYEKYQQMLGPRRDWSKEIKALGGDGAALLQQVRAPDVTALSQLVHQLIDYLLAEQADPYSYGRLMQDPRVGALARLLTTEMRQANDNVLMTFQLTYHAASHARAGKRVYEVSPGLGEKLRYTELRGLSTDDLRLPYEAIYIQVPARAKLRVHNAQTGWHELMGIYLAEDSLIPADAARGMGGGRGWRVLLCGRSKNERFGDDALSHFWVPLDPGRKLDEQLNLLADRMVTDPSGSSFGEMRACWRDIFDWLMNVVLYATWTEPGVHVMTNKEAKQLWERLQKLPRKSAKRETLKKRFRELDPQQRIVLGRNVYVLRGGDREGAGPGEEGRPLWVRTRVSGHWRNQAHGTGRKLRKLLWIEPFFRGPEDAPVSSPKHVLR